MTRQTDAPAKRERASERGTDSDGFRSDVAATYAVLAECWREPTEQLVEAVETGELVPVVGDVGSVDLRRLNAEYTRLFIGPDGPPCPPYESVYRDGDDPDELGPVKGPATMAVVRWYREFGVQPAADHPDLPDHIATELEFAAYLAEAGFDERLAQFRTEHLDAWADEFLGHVEAETREAFYASLAATTREVLGQ
ncbi:cytoplasmic chaperone TorD family protein [Haloarcula hispanica N601]|uniref:Cytoplasmic chaperone TorD family protein n=3 Tax=Haloarcula hispanica TaxID=51589 RepID=A0A482T5P4_HALHI|nr:MULTISPECIES: molecular chaperone TorD family protein [Haloarcula]AEM57408.1 cytoplasmic chaperone TorD family protein [Haloarcula hispanica ATCC 33960]AHB66173.1 cytoplasmic chaperone TorD family protein [Haloarcula hispanica N601]AJF27298.1 cytoplasmic chaperone TorD family protein [Haloarcula sp. CBA1115]KAA9406892.1 cytoplasmic chaperone TorD family protein [Haloarcula sp. CBA1131]KAA9410072.1 cytoplasmic chaperone TorD family protein [Haloarcula hispanica]